MTLHLKMPRMPSDGENADLVTVCLEVDGPETFAHGAEGAEGQGGYQCSCLTRAGVLTLEPSVLGQPARVSASHAGPGASCGPQ